MPPIPFAEWRPDMPDLGQWAREALNVIGLAESYGPFPSLQTITNALTARAQGAAWFRCPDGTQKTFAGDATKLYLLSSTTWNDVTRTVGGAYGLSASGNWRFEQFGSLAIATNGTDVLQKFDLAAGTNWTALGGTPPTAQYMAVVNDFLVLANVGGKNMRIQWSSINNAEGGWTASDPATQSDFNDEPDGGQINGIIGGEFGLLFQESAVRRMTYEGSPLIFRVDKIAKDLGAAVPNSVAGVADTAFFLHQSGFYMVQGGQNIVPIGRDKVDNTFWKEFDSQNHFRSSAAFDLKRGLYVFAYPANGNSGTPNRLLIYNVRTNKWTRAFVSTELIFNSISQQSYTLEQLDPFGTLETLPFSLDSSFWVGATQLLLGGFDTSHKAGGFNGAALAATVETSEISPGNGRRVVLRSCRPLIDGGSPQILAGYRENQQAAVAYTNPANVTSYGLAPLRRSSRYFRFRATIPAGATWSNAQGIDDVDFKPVGAR
jgi:hypothetical protein